MGEFPDYGASTGKHRQFPSSALPYILRAHAIPNVWECINSHNMEIFYGKSYHSQALSF